MLDNIFVKRGEGFFQRTAFKWEQFVRFYLLTYSVILTGLTDLKEEISFNLRFRYKDR